MTDELLIKNLLKTPEKISKLHLEDFSKILYKAKTLFENENLLLEFKLEENEEAYIIGDIHGNLESLLKLYEIINKKNPKLVIFLGDIVDRGPKQVECLVFVLALKILEPDKYFILKGNHETLEMNQSDRTIRLDGIRRIRKNHNYRERPVYLMDNKSFYLGIIAMCENIVLGSEGPKPTVEDVLDIIRAYQSELQDFAMKNQRFAVLGLSIQEPEELYQIANHYLEDFPDLQQKLSKALHDNLYKIDYFLSEADTLIAKDKFRVNLCGHDAYGIDTVRNPIWSAYWHMDKHDQMVREFTRRGFKAGDTIGIEIDSDEKPNVYRL